MSRNNEQGSGSFHVVDIEHISLSTQEISNHHRRRHRYHPYVRLLTCLFAYLPTDRLADLLHLHMKAGVWLMGY